MAAAPGPRRVRNFSRAQFFTAYIFTWAIPPPTPGIRQYNGSPLSRHGNGTNYPSTSGRWSQPDALATHPTLTRRPAAFMDGPQQLQGVCAKAHKPQKQNQFWALAPHFWLRKQKLIAKISKLFKFLGCCAKKKLLIIHCFWRAQKWRIRETDVCAR